MKSLLSFIADNYKAIASRQTEWIEELVKEGIARMWMAAGIVHIEVDVGKSPKEWKFDFPTDGKNNQTHDNQQTKQTASYEDILN